MYYAFYAPRFRGEVELRGLGDGAHVVRDYVAGKDLGRVRGPRGRLPVEFAGYLLLEVRPAPAASSRRTLPE
jgi:alpha-galactosidase